MATTVIENKEKARRFLGKTFSEGNLDVFDERVADDDTVVQQFGFIGTHDGELMEIEPGRRSRNLRVDKLRFEDDQIVEGFARADVLGFMQQLGVVEPLDE